MSNPQVETVSTGADKAKMVAAGVLVIAAVAAFYALSKQDLWLRVIVLLVVMAGAVAVFFTSENGKALIGFGRDATREIRKVVWPTRKEAMQMTGYVFAFVVGEVTTMVSAGAVWSSAENTHFRSQSAR